jgi:hypothetical protein
MTVKAFVIACCILALGAAWGQSGAAAVADPISGTWTGEFVPDGGEAVPVTFQLQFDGKGSVSGTFTGLPTPGDVKTGTFDPTTGALKLELSKQGESIVRLVLEGTVANGTATGGITGEGTGKFKLVKKE